VGADAVAGGAAGGVGTPRPPRCEIIAGQRRSAMRFRTVAFFLAVVLTVALASAVVSADTPGVTGTEIKIGNTNPYSGPASAYGTIGKAIGAYFKKVNDEGGINGRKINYITYDDSYSPPKTVEMVRKLVEQDQVALLFQTLGTPTNSAIHKYMNQQKVPHLFVATGATKWNDPQHFPWTMGFQPNYQTEGRIYAAYILKNVPDAKVGILYQNDDYGKDYLKGFEDGLGEAAKKLIVLKQSHEVTDPTIDSQIVNLKNSGANVFFNITIPKFAVQAIKKSNDIGWKPLHFLNNVSSSLGTVLKPAGLEASKGLFTALYMKEVTDPQWKNDKGYLDWVAFMKKYYPEGALDDQFNAYGYIVANLLVHTLKQCGNDLSRENIMRQAANIKNFELPLLLPGIKVNTNPTDFAPIEQEQLAKFDGERWVLFGEIYDASKK
jgi:branched-chain amino acid transport system substrate-binding protein